MDFILSTFNLVSIAASKDCSYLLHVLLYDILYELGGRGGGGGGESVLMFYFFLFSSERGYQSVSMDPGHPQPISRQSMAYFNPAIHLLQPMRRPIC